MRLDQGVIDLLNYSFISRVKDTSIKANLRPAVDSTYNLGSNERRFNYVYADNIVASTFLGDVSGNADTVDSYHAYATPTANGLLALDSSLHFPNTVYHEALLVDGSRDLTGNLAVDPGVTIDGVDISAHDADGNIHVDHTTVILTAGNGLTGGGDITTSRTFHVSAGDGIDVAADSVSVDVTDLLGDGLYEQGTNNIAVQYGASASGLDVTTIDYGGVANSASRYDHEHSITTSSDVSAGEESILASTTQGYLTLARIGLGVTPAYPLHVQATTEQFRIQYDGSNYIQFVVSDSGTLLISPSGRTTTVQGASASPQANPSTFIVQDHFTNDVTSYGQQTKIEIDPAASTSAYYYSSYMNAEVMTGNVYDVGQVVGYQAQVDHYGTGVLSNARGVVGMVANRLGGTISDARAGYFGIFNLGTGTITTAHTVRVLNATNNGTITSKTGVTIEHITTATNTTDLLVGTSTIPTGNYGAYITGTGPQLVLSYDTSHVFNFSVNAVGEMTVTGTGNVFEFGSSVDIKSDDFISQSLGWRVTYAGEADFRYIYADELRVKAFTAEIYSALAGALVITKSRATLNREFLIPLGYRNIVGVDQTSDYFSIDGDHTAMIDTTVIVADSTGNDGSYTVASISYDSGNNETDIYVNEEIPSATVDGTIRGAGRLIYVRDHEGFEGYDVFVDGDYIRLRVIDMGGGGLVVADVWGRVYNHVDDGGGEQHWTFYPLDDGGVAGSTLYEGSILLDYGADGDGTWEVTVLDYGNSPYSQVTTWTTDPSVPGNHTVHTRIGNIYGISSVDEFGIWAGDGTADADSWIRITDQNAIFNNVDFLIQSGGNAKVRASTSGYISAGAVAPTNYSTASQVGFWAGDDGGTAKFWVGDRDGEKLVWDGSQVYVMADANNYVLLNGTTVTFMVNNQAWMVMDGSTPDITIGYESGGEYIRIATSGIYMYGGTQNTAQYLSSGDVIIGQTSGTVGNLWYDYSASTLYLRRGTSNIISLPASGNASIVGTMTITGTVTAGAGDVILDSAGLTVMMDTGSSGYIKFVEEYTSSTLAWLSGASYYSGGVYHGYLSIYTTKTGTGIVTRVLYSALEQIEYHYQDMRFLDGTWDITVTGGIALGTTTNPAAGEIFSSGDHVMGGGLMVGSTSYTTDVTNGHIWFGDSNLRLYDNGSNYLRLYSNGATLDIGWSSANSQWNFNAGSGIFTMDVPLYLTSGASLVAGSGGTSGLYASYANSVSNAVRIFKESANGRIDLIVSGTVRLWINYSGDGAGSRTVGIGNGNTGFGNIHADNFVNESTRASKRNIRSFKQDIPSALDIVDQMNVLAFEKPNSGSHPNQRRLGMLAEELADVLPEVVAFDKDTNVPEGIDYGQIVPLLIEAIKELKEEVRRLS